MAGHRGKLTGSVLRFTQSLFGNMVHNSESWSPKEADVNPTANQALQNMTRNSLLLNNDRSGNNQKCDTAAGRSYPAKRAIHFGAKNKLNSPAAAAFQDRLPNLLVDKPGWLWQTPLRRDECPQSCRWS